MTANVPISETGMARIGMTEAATIAKRPLRPQRRACGLEDSMNDGVYGLVDEDGGIVDDAVFEALGKILAQLAIRSRTNSAVAKAFEPGRCWITMATAGLPSR